MGCWGWIVKHYGGWESVENYKNRCVLPVVDYRPISYILPGHGDDCKRRGWKYRACPEKKHFVRFPLSCHGAQCPSHYHDWMALEAARAMSRIRRYLKLRESQGLHSIVQHVVISAPPELLSELPMWNDKYAAYMRHFARKLLREVGLQGGWMAFHPHRIPDKFNSYTVENDGFHWHLIAFGKISPEAVSRVATRTGWIIKGLGRAESLKAVMRYVLSHCGIPVQPLLNPANSKSRDVVGHTVTWWGCVAYNALPPAETDEFPDVYCPGCHKYYPFRDWHCLEHRDAPPDTHFGDLAESDGWIIAYPDGEREPFY